MSEIVLYGNVGLTSPYVLSVFVALEEKGIPYELRLIDLGRGEQHGAEFLGNSITGRVPVLQYKDFFLVESTAITEYLEEVFTAPAYVNLYPVNGRERALVRMVQALVRSDFLPIREERSTETIFQGKPAHPLTEAAQQSVERLLRISSRLIKGPAYITGAFTLADVDLATMLQRLVKNGDPVPTAIREYADFVWERPSIQRWLAKARG